jgi:IgGFc binding protein/Secretion system C-terminal sorting domain
VYALHLHFFVFLFVLYNNIPSLHLLQTLIMNSLFIRCVFCILALCSSAVEGFAQAPSPLSSRSSRGREFYLTFLPNVHDAAGRRGGVNDSLSVYITCDMPTSGIITYRNRAGRVFSQPFQIANPAQVFIFRVGYQDIELTGFYLGAVSQTNSGYDFPNAQSERIARQSFRITANNDVTVYGLNQALYTSDAFLALPITALGTEYLVMAYKTDGNINFNARSPNETSTPSEFAVVATQDGTQVRITPSAITSVSQTTATQVVMLNSGDVYLVQASPSADGGLADLTGSRVVANKPIAVFGGHQRTTLPVELRGNPLRTRDHLVEQLPGLETWGKSAFITPFVRAQGEVDAGTNLFRVLAAYDSTRVFFNGQFVQTLRAGEYFEEQLINPGVITASDQILVAQFKKTSSTTDGNDFRGDPFMLLIPTVEQYDNSYRFVNVQAFDPGLPSSTGGQVFDLHYVTLVAPNSTLDNIRFDERLVGRASFQPIANSAYSFVNLTSSAGTHTARADSAFGVYVYGYGILNSYGYVGGGKMRIIAPDRDAPLLVARDTCFGVRGAVFDTLLTDSRIASVQTENVRNMDVRIAPFRPFADSVTFTAQLQNLLLDGSFTLVARDSAGFVTRRSFLVQGLTVAVEGQNATVAPLEQRFTIDVGRSRAFRIPIVNYGTTTQTISTIQLVNDQQSPTLRLLAPRFPLTLAPNQRDTVVIEFQSPQTGTFSANLVIANACQQRTIARAIIQAGQDMTAPTITSSHDYCARIVSLRLTDSEPFPSGIRALQAIGQLINCTLQIDPMQNSLSVQARLSIQNPRRDAIYTLQVIDSAGNERVIRDTIQGFTIELQGSPATVSTFGAIQITTLECKPITYRNVGVKPFVINRFAPNRNIWFSLPEVQFPIIIPPGASRSIQACFAPLVVQQQYRDTLVLDAFCVQDVLPLTGEGTPLVRLNPSRCSAEIRLTTSSAPLNYFMEQNYPNPSSSFTTILVGATESSPVKLTVYNSLGTLVDTPLQSILPIGISEIQLDVSRLETGLYFYQLQTSQTRLVRQFYVVR